MTFEIFFGLYVISFIAYPLLVFLIPKLYLDKLPGCPDLRLQRHHESVRWIATLVHLLVMFMPYVNFIASLYLVVKIQRLHVRQARALEKELEQASKPFRPLK